MTDKKGKGRMAIILSGGGMRSAHGAGFLYAFATKLKIAPPDIMIGSSGNAVNVAYYAAGQYEEMKRVWLKRLSTPKFISLWRFWKVMDVDYLIDTVFKQQEPLDTEKLKSSTIHWFIPISNFRTGNTRYVSAADNFDPLELLRAATAIPIYFGKKIPLEGQTYVDGELGPVLQDHVSYALKQGATKILVINNTKGWNFVSRRIMRAYAGQTPEGMHDAIIHDISTDVSKILAPGASVIVVTPKKLRVNNFTHNQESLRKTFDRGVADALAFEEELRSLFSAT